MATQKSENNITYIALSLVSGMYMIGYAGQCSFCIGVAYRCTSVQCAKCVCPDAGMSNKLIDDENRI